MKIIRRNYQFMVFFVLLAPVIAMSNDLDDGIALDEPINDDLKTGVNIPFIMMKAKGAQGLQQKGVKPSRPVIVNDGVGGQGNQVFGIGTKFGAGTTIINAAEIKNSNSISGNR